MARPRRKTTVTLDELRTLADLYEDLQQLRMASDNRVSRMELERGDAMPHLRVLGEAVGKLEHDAELELVHAWRSHPLAPWAKSVPGLGEKSIARLISVIGDPAERPNVAKLWAYCGHGDPNRSWLPRSATQAEIFKRGNLEAKTAVWRIATQFRKTMNSPYRKVYEEARERYADRTHQSPCVRCGPRGQPAQPGTPWNAGHQDAAAVRLVGKRFLQDLYDAAKRARVEVVQPEA